MSYISDFQDLVSQLENHQAIRVEKVNLRDGIKDWQLEMVYESHEIVLDDQVLSLYKEVNGVDITWVVNLDKANLPRKAQDDSIHEIFGRVEIYSLQKLLRYDNFLDGSSWSSRMDEEEYQDLKNFRYIDYNDDDVRVGFLIDNGEIRDELVYLLRNSEGFGELNCKLHYYIEALIQAKGFNGWQRTFIFRDSEQLRQESDLFFYIPQLFPEEDFRNFI